MKNLKLLALLWFLLISWTLIGCTSNKPEVTEENTSTGDFIIEDITDQYNAAIDYNDKLVDLAAACINSENDIWTAYDDENSSTNDVQTAISSTLNECNAIIEQINTLGDREWDSSLKDGVIAIIEKDINYYSKFSELLPYLELENPTDEEAEASAAILNELDALDAELNEANANLVTLQAEFAANHWYELEEWNTEEVTE